MVKVGDILIAKDPCTMEISNVDALIVGKEYRVYEVEDDGTICIESEVSDSHFYNVESYFGIYFDIKP
jgi:hypothetical protein